MTHETKNPLLLVLCKGATGSRVAVELESFLKFNAQMDYELQYLVDRWSDYMTPNSRRDLRPSRRRR
jgi:hypothetical protein